MKEYKKRNIKTALLLSISLLFFASCKEIQYVPVERVDTVYINKISTDTMIFRDSVYVEIKGDTCHIEKVKYVYKNSLVRDTVLQNVYVEKPVEVTKYVEIPKQMNAFEKAMFVIGLIATAFGALLLILKIKDK